MTGIGRQKGQIHRTHSDEFKAEAVSRATEPGAILSHVAADLDLASSVLTRWVRKAQGRTLPSDYVSKNPNKGRQYTPEFKAEALRRAAEPGAIVAHIAEEMDVSAFSINAWRRQAEEAKKGGAVSHNVSPPGQPDRRDEEIARLRAEVAKLTKERDHLKKTLAHYLTDGG